MAWSFTDPVARSWLARLHALKARASSMRDDVESTKQHIKRLDHSGRQEDALNVLIDAKRDVTNLSDEVDGVVAQLKNRGVRACGLENVVAPMEQTREDLDQLAATLYE